MRREGGTVLENIGQPFYVIQYSLKLHVITDTKI